MAKLICAATAFSDEAFNTLKIPKGFIIDMGGGNELWVPINISDTSCDSEETLSKLGKSIKQL